MAGNPINVYISPKQKRMMNHNQDPYSDEIYRLPIVVTERDIQIEKEYMVFYDDDYWERYNKLKLKEYDDIHNDSLSDRDNDCNGN